MMLLQVVCLVSMFYTKLDLLLASYRLHCIRQNFDQYLWRSF